MLTYVRQNLLDLVLAGGVLLLATVFCRVAVLACDLLGGYFSGSVAANTNKLTSLEGLRGILALAVVAHHASCYYSYTQTGLWSNGTHILFARFGPFGVGQFFYISGFLFWRKLMKKGSIDFKPFYISRFVRIAPVYYTCIFLAICVGIAAVGFGLHTSLGELFKSLLAWACFTIGIAPPVDGADMERVTSGVTWTLACEWAFYLSLPLLGWFSRKSVRLLHLLVVLVTLFAICKFLSSGYLHNDFLVDTFLFIRQFAKFMILGFGGGIVIATFLDPVRSRVQLSLLQLNLLLAGLYAFYFLSPNFRGTDVLRQISLFVAFGVVILGADLFGFLKSKAIRFLGVISYDLYLVHGMVLYAAMQLRGGMHPITAQTYGIETACAVVVILFISTVVHFTVERPSMRLSEELAHRVGQKGGAGLPEAVIT